jgi:ABC-type nickel/cobalt efflux system permease component RcnA
MLPARSLRVSTALLFSLLLVVRAHAHPMGNFSVNHYSGIELQEQQIVVHYYIDLAEIPAYQELQRGSIGATPEEPAVKRYVSERGAELERGLTLTVNGMQIPLHLVSSGVIFPPGAGGLPTMKMGFVYEAAYPQGADRELLSVRYTDNNYAGQTGWKEIVAHSSAGALLSSSAPSKDRSGELSNYPTDLLTSPPQDLEATVVAKLEPVATTKALRPAAAEQPSLSPHAGVTVSKLLSPTRKIEKIPQEQPESFTPHVPISQQALPAVHLEANRQQTPRSKFTQLIAAQHLSAWFLFSAALIAIGLGGMHALEPGHGKTIVAAYLVGSRGNARHALLLGLIVTVSHTAGVFALGAITLCASRYIVPEQLYPWLSASSGITIAALGCYMLLRRLTGTASDHSHAPGGAHGHWFPFKRSNQNDVASDKVLPGPTSTATVSLVQLCTLGITGGIIPCPAALVVLLSALALHRIGLGFFLIVAFSLGLAAVLIAFGMVMVYARRFITRLHVDGPLTRRWLPAASSAFIAALGLMVTIQALWSTHFRVTLLTHGKLAPMLMVIGLGLILGMRHSTDSDHVVAISTIVSKQKSIRGAALIGSVWGLGHTITIFVVGSLIILFGIEIPIRVGLSMEFCVALMLVLLGVLNLTGVAQAITNRFTPSEKVFSMPQNTGRSGGKLWDAWLRNSIGQLGAFQFLRPLVIGLVHGLAGSAAVALLVLSTIHNPYWATFYLLIFGMGTMIGMMCMTAAMAVPLRYAGVRFARLSQYLGAASGMVSLCFGAFLVYQLGFVGGLFTAHPQWTPQ